MTTPDRRHKTFLEQSATYFHRPHVAPAIAPVGGPAAWRAADLLADPGWTYRLTDADVDALDDALDRAAATRQPLDSLRRGDTELGALQSLVARWAHELRDGPGVVLVRGVPVQRWDRQRAELAAWVIGLHLGEPGAQNLAGDLLGHVRDTTGVQASTHTRLYQTNAGIRFHCDYADVVGLLCLAPALEGGESRIASSTAIHDELVATEPELAARLYEPVWLDNRDELAEPARSVRPFAHDGSRVRTFYHGDYFRSAARHGAGYAPDAVLERALERFDELANDERFCVRMELERGDLQLLSNHSVVHARTDYVDDVDEPRHLLRLWLSLDPTT